jgi:hypothetical protein
MEKKINDGLLFSKIGTSMLSLQQIKKSIELTQAMGKLLEDFTKDEAFEQEVTLLRQLFADRDQILKNAGQTGAIRDNPMETKALLQELIQLDERLHDRLCQERSALFNDIMKIKNSSDYFAGQKAKLQSNRY